MKKFESDNDFIVNHKLFHTDLDDFLDNQYFMSEHLDLKKLKPLDLSVAATRPPILFQRSHS